MLGGYNEEFHPTGCQDFDLYESCKMHQATRFEGSSVWSIPNTLSKKQGARAQFKVSKSNTTLKWHEQNDANWEISKTNIKNGCWWANYHHRLRVRMAAAIQQKSYSRFRPPGPPSQPRTSNTKFAV